jgi:hypothetical protein
MDMSANAMTEQKITTTIRLESELHFQLVKRATDENRSINNMIETLLKKEFQTI